MFLFVGAALLPLLVFAIVQASIAASTQRKIIERGLLDESRALAVAVQNELVASVSTLDTLATSTALDTGDVAAFREEAVRARREGRWSDIWLARPDGREIMSVARVATGDVRMDSSKPYFVDALRTRRPAVSGIVADGRTGGSQIVIAVPVLRDGNPEYVLAGGVRPETLSRILRTAEQREGLRIAAVIDRDFVILARTHDPAGTIGRKASTAIVSSIGNRNEGLFEARTLDGYPVYSAFKRIPDTQWLVTVALTRDEVEGPLRRMLLYTVGSGVLFFLAATAISTFLVRRMTAPIAQLAAAARDIANGKAVDVPAHRYAREIATLAEALQAASEGTRERQRMAREFAFRLQHDVEDERRRIARSFHDDLGQRLTLIAMSAEILRGKTADAEHHRLLDGLNESVRAAVTSMRRIIADIRPPEMELGIANALHSLLDEWTARTGIAHALTAEGEFGDLPEGMLVTLFRIVQEALNNVSKHASATKVDVELRRLGAEVSLAIHDDGIGMDVGAASGKPGHFGLFGIGERAAQFAGSARVLSAPGEGTTIRVSLQVPEGEGVARSGRGGIRLGNRFAADERVDEREV